MGGGTFNICQSDQYPGTLEGQYPKALPRSAGVGADTGKGEKVNKFWDPKTGDVFENIRDAYTEFCNGKSAKECNDCPIAIKNNQKHLFCFEYVFKFPTEAARLMGYEVIEVSSTKIDETPSASDTPTVSDDTPTEEDNNMKKISKPRLAELLGVEVGEKFQVKGVDTKDFAFFVDAEGIMRWTDDGMISDLIIYTIINHPERIVRLPRLTEPEIVIMRAFGAKCVSRADISTSVALLWDTKPRKYPDGVYRACWFKPIATVDSRFFPSVKPGDCVELEEASHGESDS